MSSSIRAIDPSGKGSRIDFFSYPIQEYLQVAWTAADRLEGKLGGVGLPGYLESRYLAWRRSQGRSGSKMVRLRTLSMLNLLAAGVVFVAWSATQ